MEKSKTKAKPIRLRILHFANLFFITYLVAVIFEISIGRSIRTFLVILANYLLIHFMALILKKYGKSKAIEALQTSKLILPEPWSSSSVSLFFASALSC